MKFNRSVIAKFGAAALALGAMGMAPVAQARDHVAISIGANIAPGVFVGASNGYPVYGAYATPVYAAPVYAPAPVYVQPSPVYYDYGPTVVYRSAPVYYGGYYGRHGHYYNRAHYGRGQGEHRHH